MTVPVSAAAKDAAPQRALGIAPATAHADASTETASAATKGPSANGHHWMLDLSDCRCDPRLLQHAGTLRDLCVRACRDAGMSVVGEVFHQFHPHGVTGVVLLSESHLSIHTWPEVAFAAVDVYVCDHDRGNAHRGHALARALEEMLLAARAIVRDVERQSIPVLP